MKKIVSISLFIILFVSCTDKKSEMDQWMENTREGLSKQGKQFNKENENWDKCIDSIYKLSSQNHVLAYQKIDKLILYYSKSDLFKVQELHFVKGDLYFLNDSLIKSVDEFTKSGINWPKSLAARASVYLKLNRNEECLKDLVDAANINNEYYWDIGNYFEVLKNRETAIFYYNNLYVKNKTAYKYCNDRIVELRKPTTRLFTKLKYRNRDRLIFKMEE